MINPDKKQKNVWWKIISAVAILLIIITYTPLVIIPGKIEPKLLSMPYTLWVSIIITITLVFLTYLGGKVHLDENDDPIRNNQEKENKKQNPG